MNMMNLAAAATNSKILNENIRCDCLGLAHFIPLAVFFVVVVVVASSLSLSCYVSK